MADTSSKNAGKLFKNPILEKLTRTHISIPITILTGAAIGLIIYGMYHGIVNTLEVVLLFLAGLFVFTLTEYLMHRYLYHIEPSTESRKKLQYTIHGVHHDYPNDKERLAMPPIVSAILAVIVFSLFYLIMGRFAYGFTPGFFVGYSSYLFIHYSVHAFAPPRNFLKELWVHHSIHHYKDQEKAFGVSSPLWDYIFRTMPARKK